MPVKISLVMGILALLLVSTRSVAGSNGAVTAPYCRWGFTMDQFAVERERNSYMLASIKEQYAVSGTHLIPAVIAYLNNRKTSLQEFMQMAGGQIVSNLLLYFSAGGLLLIMTLVWCRGIFSKAKARVVKQEATKRIELSVKTQIGLAGMILSLLVVIALALYGINQGGHIARGVNQLACNIFTEPVGFQRGEETSKPISGLDWFSKRLMALQGEQFVPLARNWSRVVADSSLFATAAQITQAVADKPTRMDGAGRELNDFASFLQNVSLGTIAVDAQLQIFTATLQYVREVSVGYRILLSNLEKYLNRYLGISSTARLLGLSAQLVYFWFILVALSSMVALTHVLINQIYDREIIKDIVLYFMGGCCGFALLMAFGGSVAVPVSVWSSQALDLGLEGEGQLRLELGATEGVNGMVTDVIAKFHPSSDGNYSRVNGGRLVKQTTALIGLLEEYKGVLSSQIQSVSARQQLLEDLGSQLGLELSSNLSYQFQQQVTAAQTVLKSMLSALTDPESGLNELNPAAMGQYVLRIKEALYIPLFNSLYEQTWILGYSAWGFLSALFFASLIHEFARKHVHIVRVEDEREKLAVADGGEFEQQPHL